VPERLTIYSARFAASLGGLMASPDDEELDGPDEDWADDDDDAVEEVEEVELDDVEEVDLTAVIGTDDDEDDADTDDENDEEDEALDELEAEERDMLTEDEEAESLPVDEAEELRKLRREAIELDTPAETAGLGEFVCSSCFLVKRSSQLADKRKQLCRDCA
jgi:hypothetical protein